MKAHHHMQPTKATAFGKKITTCSLIISIIFLVLSFQTNPTTAATNNTSPYGDYPHPQCPPMTLADFTHILNTTIESEITTDTVANNNLTAEGMMEDIMSFEWSRAYNQEVTKGQSTPYLICYSSSNATNATNTTIMSGWERREALLSMLLPLDQNLTSSSIVTVYNSETETCFVAHCLMTAAASLRPVSSGVLKVLPLGPTVKMMAGTLTDAGNDGNETGGEAVAVDAVLCPGVSSDGGEELPTEGEALRTAVLDYLFRQKNISEEFYWLKDSDDVLSEGDNTTSPNSNHWKHIMDDALVSSSPCAPLYSQLNFTLTPRLANGVQSLAVLSVTTPVTLNLTNVSVSTARMCGTALVACLASLPQVCSVQIRPLFQVKNVEAQWILQSGKEEKRPWFDVGLTGKGQFVAVSDTGVDRDNCYFWDKQNQGNFRFGRDTMNMNQRKIVAYDPFVDGSDYVYGHGTHVCGTVLGHRATDGITESDGFANGVAPDARLAFIDIGSPDGKLAVPDTNRLLSTGRPNAKIHSASWGSSFAGIGATGFSFDQYLYENDAFFVAVAAGNSGRGDTPRTVGDPATAKNVLAVGAGQNMGGSIEGTRYKGMDYIADFSSRGPTLDGRMKPDVIAPGAYLLSAGSIPQEIGECDPDVPPSPGQFSWGLLSIQGTSMATPATAGTAALIRQYFEEGYYPSGAKNQTHAFNPSASLVKAVIMNGAQYMTAVDNGMLMGLTPVAPYDINQNFGRVSLAHSLYLPSGRSEVECRLWDRLVLNDGMTKQFSVPIINNDTWSTCSVDYLSVTIVWADPPAMTGCMSCLINDLDLFVTKQPANSTSAPMTYYPNGLNRKDSKNNAERVIIPNVKHGEVYTVNVKAANLATSSQKYALVVTGCVGVENRAVEMVDDDYVSPSEIRNRWLVIGLGILGGALGLGLIVLAFIKCRDQRENVVEVANIY